MTMTQRFVTYYRVSTARQGTSGLGLEAQQREVAAWLSGRDHTVVGTFTEVESGKRSDRPALADALALCRRTKATLVIAKLDRLARNVAFIANLMESGVPFVAVDRPDAKAFELHIYAAMAEEEARQISARTKAGLASAKGRGVKLGNPRMDEIREKSLEARTAAAKRHASTVLPVIQQIQATGTTTPSGIAAELTRRQIPTSQGGLTWQTVQVQRLMARI